MLPNAVLVIGLAEAGFCAPALAGLGLTPIVCTDMADALRALRRRSFAAVCVHAAAPRVDVLECVLNIRDVDTRTPVLILESERIAPLHRVLRRQPGVVLIGGQEVTRPLSASLEKAGRP